MFKSIQHNIVLALSVTVPFIAQGATLNVDDAKNVAVGFFENSDVNRLARKDALVHVHTATDAAAAPVCYVFNARDGKGFVIVSADDRAMPILGYSETSTWTTVPEAAESVLSAPVLGPDGGKYVMPISRASEDEGKLLATPSWSQEAPFNNNIPGRRLTGCVGVALAEILKYHSYPKSRPASLVNAGDAVSYDWESMRSDNYRSGYTQDEASAVATLVADAAIAIGTDFGMSSSSAFEVKVPYALTSTFGYDAGVSYKKRSELSKAEWEAVIVNEINENRPVLYSGQDVSSGHAFVCDGYQKRAGGTYFHINWGWGGSADGYFASDALNPVVSRAHSYNDLMTIVYNIKPAAEGALEWSPIHITSDERQVGLTIDTDNLTPGGSFTARAGALKNISNSNFSGQLAIALYSADGTQKALLSDGSNLSLQALQILKYADFTGKVPAAATVAADDVVRLVAKASGSDEWLPVAGDLLAPGDAAAKNGTIPYFVITLPASTEAAEISGGEARVIKGRDYSFSVLPKMADKVITIKANGFIITPDANNSYRLNNVIEDQTIEMLVQNAADVLTKSILWNVAGTLGTRLSEQEAATVTDLTIFGTLNADDFTFMRDRMKLERLDISRANISALGSNPANAIPAKAFSGVRSLKTILLPTSLTTLKNGCFNNTGLTSIEIPASVSTFEYNIFLSCRSLQEVTVRRATPAWVNWCVFEGTPKARLVVPVGATAAYKAKEYWQDFKTIEEQNPVAPSSYSLAVQEKKGVKFTPVTEGTEFTPGSVYTFGVETDDSFGDANMEVYANSERLYPDASGLYSAKITANTLLHYEFSYPQATTVDNAWKITGAEGGVGMVTDVVNVPVGKAFDVRINAIKVPAGYEASKFYAMVLTDKDGAIKEFISPVMTNMMSTTGNLSLDFGCKVTEASVREGNLLRLATSYNKKDWTLVAAEGEGVADRLPAVGNRVVYHSVTMPETLTGATITGATTQIVRGMPLNLKVAATSPTQRVTLAVNGVSKAAGVAIANVTIPAVTEDLDIAIQIHDAGASDYVVVNVQEGELASKIGECPDRLKIIGTMLESDFDALRANASKILDLDLADVTIKGAAMTRNAIPTSAFAPTTSTGTSALRSVVLPASLERISDNAFARCGQLAQVIIPAGVNYVGSGAFSACTALTKIVMAGSTPPATGSMTPLPSNTSKITLEVPKGAESAYSAASYWSSISPQVAKTYYWIKYDPAKMFVYTTYYGDASKIEVSNALVQLNIGLPNCPTTSRSGAIYRDGVVFKLYDNDKEVATSKIGITSYGGDTYGGGQYLVKLDPTCSPIYNDYVKNHTLDLVFYYPIDFELLDGAEGVKTEVVGFDADDKYTASMATFGKGMTGTRVTYREGKDYKVRLTAPSPNVALSVQIENKIMTKPGVTPEYETVVEDVYPDGDGLYTISSLPGDTKVKITGSLQIIEGEPVAAEELAAVDKETVEEFAELTVTGAVDENTFEVIREKFESLESLDLSKAEIAVLPENAFAGMDQLRDVIVSDEVTAIGSGCFKDCGNIESLTLPSVTQIGEGAFEGCESLTSIIIPSAGRTLSRASETAGITAASFKGLNPNCIIYVGDTEIADADEFNIIVNKDGNRVATSDIVLDGRHPFNAPASFNLGGHRISMTIDIPGSIGADVDGGWKGIMLPFAPTGMTYGVEIGERKGSGLHLLSFEGEDAVALTTPKAIEPNRPYMANVCAPYASVPVTFYAEGNPESDAFDVAFTPVPEETVAVGKDFSLYGTFDGEIRHMSRYTLNKTASAFVHTDAADELTVMTPFAAYLGANEGIEQTEMTIGVHPLWVMEPTAAEGTATTLYRSGKVELATVTKGAEIYYTTDGSDPADAQGSRKLYSAPFAMDGENITVKAVAEYKGYASDAVSISYSLKQAEFTYELAGNWHWISHPVESAVAAATFATEGIDSIVAADAQLVRDPQAGLTGSLTELAPAAAYKVRLSSGTWTGTVKGIAFDPATPVKLAEGWNWIGCPVIEGSLRVADLLANLEVEEGDMLVGQEGFTQVDAEGNWKGVLAQMTPGTGYMFYSKSAKEFAFNISAPATEAQAEEAPAGSRWEADIHKYASVMPVTAELYKSGDVKVATSDYEVAAFCGDECRGTGVVVDGVMMINVHGNAGDAINFRFIGPEGEDRLSASTVTFAEKPLSSISDPYHLDVEGMSGIESISGSNEIAVRYVNGDIVLSGNLDDVKAVEVYNLAGTLVAKTNYGTDTISGLEPGVVIVRVTTSATTLTSKVLVK